MSKPINRTDHLSNIKQIPGTTIGVVYDQNGKGPRQIACPKCQSNCISPSRDGNGKIIYVCACGAQFTSTRM
jgi:hypothetical protein